MFQGVCRFFKMFIGLFKAFEGCLMVFAGIFKAPLRYFKGCSGLFRCFLNGHTQTLVDFIDCNFSISFLTLF